MSLPILVPVLCAIVALPAGGLAAALARPYAAAPSPVRLPVVMAATILAFAWAGLVMPPDWRLLAGLGLGWTLVCLATIDLIAFRLPDIFTLPLLVSGVATALVLPGRPILEHGIGAVAGWTLLVALGWLYRRWRGVDGIGLGDAKLLAAGGAWLGWPALPSILLVACGVSLAWIAAGVLRGRRAGPSTPIAFGAPLCLAIWVVWLYGSLVT